MEDIKKVEVPRVYKVQKISKKTGQPYECLILVYNGYQKMLFLEGAESFVFQDLPLTSTQAVI